jgi:pimeloyl-ACP methyl ester carboxylesterase
MTARLANVNGVNIAYRVQGDGPPLVLVMGYRLNSTAWPVALIEQLAQRFTVITLDNRGTGLSDKPVDGYAIANLARDVRGLLDHLGIEEVGMLGYSMGGAIAQEFVRQFPERISQLILCATMAGGPSARYANWRVVRVMRDLDGLSPEQAARRIWKVTYSPRYLERHRDNAEQQMLREIALPTPLHAADLQFQAFAEFDGSNALADIRCPTLVLTGDLDELILPQNSRMMADRIPNAKLAVIPGGGHRVLWEATATCIDLITGFLTSTHVERVIVSHESQSGPAVSDALPSALELLAAWPFALAKAGLDSLLLGGQWMTAGNSSRFGDGKPIILVPRFLGTDIALIPLSLWLKALGYRPLLAGLFVNLQSSSDERSLSRAIHDITQRVGRKAVLMTHSSGMAAALHAADAHRESISDVIIFEAPYAPNTADLRVHLLSSNHLQGMTELPQLLRSIGIELIGEPGLKSQPLESENSLSSPQPYLDRSSVQQCNDYTASRALKKEEASGGSNR